MRLGKDKYKLHYLGLSDNVSYLVEQLKDVNVSSYHYIVRIKPQSVLPDIRIKFDNSQFGYTGVRNER